MGREQNASRPPANRRLIALLIVAGILAVGNVMLLIFVLPAQPPAIMPTMPAPQPTLFETPHPSPAAEVSQATRKPIMPGLYAFQNLTHLNGYYTDPQLTGSQLEILWRQVNGQGEGIYDWSVIDDWVALEKARGNKWVLRVLLYQNRGAYGIPAWVEKRMTPPYWVYTSSVFPAGLKLPNYRDPALWRALRRFVSDLGARYDSDPDLALVQIGLGLYGEMHPERNDEFGNLKNWYYERDPIYGRRLPPCDWIRFVTETVAAYADAFPRTPLVIMQSPSYGYKCDIWDPGPPLRHIQYWERVAVEEYCLLRGVGFQNNSLDEWDANWFTCAVTGSTGPYVVYGSMQSAVDNWREIPVVFERGSWLAPYNKFFKVDYFQTWWSYLNALDKHADIIFPPNWAGEIWADGRLYRFPAGVWRFDAESPDIPYAAELRWMNQFALDHLGKDERNTPDVWTVMFDTPTSNCTAQQRDHQFFLYRMERTADGQPIPNAGTVFEQDVYAMPPFYEGKYTRRTDQANGQYLMYFDIDDAYHYAASPSDSRWIVTIWYLNNGSDSMLFEYRDQNGQVRSHLIRKPGGPEIRWVQTTFTLENAFFANNMGYGADFRISSAKDGPDEYIHMVRLRHELREGVVPTATSVPDGRSTPTRTPTPARTVPVTATAVPTMPPDATPAMPTPGMPFDAALRQGFDGYQGVSDTYVNGWAPDENFGSDQFLAIRAGDWMATLIRFDLRHIPSNAFVESAKLRLYVASRSNSNPLGVVMYRLARSWEEGTTTWTQAGTGVEWAVAGVRGTDLDIVGDPLARFTLDNTGQWYEIDMGQLVREWVAWPESNYGIVLRGESTMGVQYNLSSSDHPNGNLRPTLLVRFVLPTPTSTATLTSTPTPTATPSPTSTATETVTPTLTSTSSPSHTPTRTPTPSETPGDIPSPTSSLTATPVETAMPTGTPSATSSFAASPTPTDTPSLLPTATDTPGAPVPTETQVPIPTGRLPVIPHTSTPTATMFPTPFPSPSRTPLIPSTSTWTPTPKPMDGRVQPVSTPQPPLVAPACVPCVPFSAVILLLLGIGTVLLRSPGRRDRRRARLERSSGQKE